MPDRLTKVEPKALEDFRHNRAQDIDVNLSNVMTTECSAAMVYFNDDRPKDSDLFSSLEDASGAKIETKLKAPHPTPPQPVLSVPPTLRKQRLKRLGMTQNKRLFWQIKYEPVWILPWYQTPHWILLLKNIPGF